MSKLKNEKKEIRCKKCNKLLAKIIGKRICIKGEIEGEISGGKYRFECLKCKKIITGTIK